MNQLSAPSIGIWGLLGPESLPSSRRTRTLGLAAAVRQFNELAVPGLGGVWYGKRVLLALLGVVVAEAVRSEDRNTRTPVSNIQVANAIEALACLLAFRGNGWTSDPRLRGSTKLDRSGVVDVPFAKARQASFYVNQPMRMATVQALPALGLVAQAARFNAFQSTERGREFVDLALSSWRPMNRTVVEQLKLWVMAQASNVDTPTLRQALSPLSGLSPMASSLLRQHLQSGSPRRANALAWVTRLARNERLQKQERLPRPAEIDEAHWTDILAGADFFKIQGMATTVLDSVETAIGPGRVPILLEDAIRREATSSALKNLAAVASGFNHESQEAQAFCRACANSDKQAVLRELLKRDGHVLRLDGAYVCPAGPAFQGHTPDEDRSGTDADDEGLGGPPTPIPDGFSFRLGNLYRLALDLDGRLDDWLASANTPRMNEDTSEVPHG